MTILKRGLVSLLAVATASTLYAAQFEIMPTVGKKIANDDTTLDDSKVLFGLRGTAYVTPNIGIQGVVESSVDNPTAGGGDTDIERGALNVIVQRGVGKVKPYALAGVGYEATHGNSVKTTNDDSQMFYNAGVGLKFDLTDRLNLVTEVKGMHKVENDDDDIIGTVGLGVKLGAVAQKKPTCETPQALTLEQFSKMCKTTQPAPAPMPVEKMQSEPVVQETAPVVEEAAPEVMDEKTAACVVEVENEAPNVVEGTTESAEIPEGYYIQMAALFKGSGEILTSRLERKNYPYVLHQTERFGKDATLVLVGPYETRKEAAVALRYLKRLSRKAFIKRFP